MMRALLERLAAKLPPPRVIYDRLGQSPYLSRYYLLGRPRMRDGSEPTDENGTLRPGVVWETENFGIYLHKFHRGDDDLATHSHPWRWAVSLILAGGYREERRLNKTCRCGHARGLHRDRYDPKGKGSPWPGVAGFFSRDGSCTACDDCTRFVGKIIVGRFRPGMLNFIRADDYHRVDLTEHDCWSLFITGPKVGTWYFRRREDDERVHWRAFINELRDREAFARARGS